MRIALLALLSAAVLAGCSKNSIEIQNDSLGTVTFLFRGTQTDVAVGSTTTIADAPPNGSFDYSTVYAVPAGTMTTQEAGGLSGNLLFEQSKTRVLIAYAGARLDSTYKISASVTTSRNKASVVTP